jgi:DNA helicase HerA-like ATPase
MWDKAKENRTVEKCIFVPEAWKLIGAGSNAQVAGYILEVVKIGRGYGCSIVIDTQYINDFFALEDGKFGRGILNNCKTKIILNMEDEEAQRVQSLLRLTDTEIMNVTHFSRGSGLISTNNNNVTVEFKSSEYEKELITSDRYELSKLLAKKRGGETE